MTLLDPPSCSNIETRLTNVDQHCEIASSSRQGYIPQTKGSASYITEHLSLFLSYLLTRLNQQVKNLSEKAKYLQSLIISL